MSRPSKLPGSPRAAAAMVAHDPQHGVPVGLAERGEGALLAGHLRRSGVGDAGHERADGAAERPALGAVVGKCRATSAARRGWRSRGRACGRGRSVPRSRARGTAPSPPRSRARRSTAARHARSSPTSKLPSSRRKVIRLSEARLQAVSSRNMYSEQGLDARIAPACRAGVPVVDGGVELDARIGRGPGGFDRSESQRLAGVLMVFATLPSVRRIRSHAIRSRPA